MGGIANGIAYHGGFIPYAATFLTFSDYMRGSVRLAALSGLQVIYVWTHDSVGLGEDGPTHQPVEHYAALRAIPNLWFVRPGDANETAAAWALAIERGQEDPSGPVALSLTRQKLPTLAGTAEKAREGVRRGGYVLRDAAGGKAPQIILIGTGSELQLAFGAAEALEADGHRRPGRVAPLLGAVRAPGRGLPRVRAAALDPCPGRRRGRRLARLGSLGRRRGRDHRPRPLRGVGAGRARSSRRSASRSTGSSPSRATSSPARSAARARRSSRATCPRPAAATPDPPVTPAAATVSHPTLDQGEAGVGRTASSDPGHS